MCAPTTVRERSRFEVSFPFISNVASNYNFSLISSDLSGTRSNASLCEGFGCRLS